MKRVRVPHKKYVPGAEKVRFDARCLVRRLNGSQSFCEGIATWKHLNHRHVVSLIGATLSPLQLISKWMPNGDLSEYIRDHLEANLIDLVGLVASRFFRAYPSKLSGVVKGIHYLHSCDVIHGEIKGVGIYSGLLLLYC